MMLNECGGVKRLGPMPLALAALVLLSGCNLGPDFQRPSVDLPADFAEAAATQAVPVWPEDGWWRGFGSTELDGLIAEAQRANFDLAAAAARIRQATAQAVIAGAPLQPTLDLSGSGQRQQAALLKKTPGARQTISNSFSLTLQGSYEIDFWGKNAAAFDSANASLLASQYDAATVALTTVSNVANTYFTILSLRERLGYARQSLADAEAVLAAIRARFQVGTASLIDEPPQQTIIEQQRATIAALEQQLTQQTNALAVLLAVPPQRLSLAASDLTGLKVPVVGAGLPSGLLRRRPDVANAEAQLVAANADVRNAIAARFPSLSLTANGGLESAALRTLFDPVSQLFSIAASLSAPIFQGGSLAAKVDLNRARFDELAADYQKSVISAFADVETALAGIRQTAAQMTAQEAATAASKLAFEATQAQYRVGVIDSLSVRDAERTYFSSQDQLAQSRLAYYQALVSLFKALGGGWETPAAP